MPHTKRNSVILRRSTYKRPRETKIHIGPNGNIRSSQDHGDQLLSCLPESVLIDGCDWRGAFAIFNYLSNTHRSIYENDIYYFMMPETFDGLLLRDNALFVILFHHIYNYFLLKEPWSCPPFRSPIKTKYEYIQRIFKNDDFDCTVFLKRDLEEAQKALKEYQFNDWSDFVLIFKEPWSKEPIKQAIRTEKECLSLLKVYFENAEDISEFLKSPIDNNENLLMELVPKRDGSIIDRLCNLILDKIDQHIIFQQTGVKPISRDWIKDLDIYLF